MKRSTKYAATKTYLYNTCQVLEPKSSVTTMESARNNQKFLDKAKIKCISKINDKVIVAQYGPNLLLSNISFYQNDEKIQEKHAFIIDPIYCFELFGLMTKSLKMLQGIFHSNFETFR